MNISKKTILIDTNVITDLSIACLLDKFVKLNNICISDMVKQKEFNESTCNINLIKDLKCVPCSSEQILEIFSLCKLNNKLSQYDIIGFILARDNNYVLATGDKRLRKFAESNKVEFIGTLGIIKYMLEINFISINDVINACNLLLNSDKNRISNEIINNFLDNLHNHCG